MNRALSAALRAVRRRRRYMALALGLAPALALAWLARAQSGEMAALVVLAAAAIAGLLWAHEDRRRHDLRWYLRALDGADRRFEDSAALLVADPATLSPLARLQQQRLQARVAGGLPDLRPSLSTAPLAASLAVAASALLLSLWTPTPVPVAGTAAPTETRPVGGPVRLVDARLEVTPPRYTGLKSQPSESLDARVPEGSSLHWQLDFAPSPRSARLRFHDGRTVDLRKASRDEDTHRTTNEDTHQIAGSEDKNEDTHWIATTTIAAAALYRIEIDADTPLADDRRYRLDVIADRPPQIRVDAPDKTLSLRESTQQFWDFDIRASDDYALGEAALEITRAQGSGENIQVRQQTQRLRGEGDARERRYRHRIDLAALELAPGDEVIVRFNVADTRTPQPQRSRSASYILRLPPPQADDGVGMEGLVRTTLPAYFRSQRQIIIDTEALIAERPRLDEARFLAKSDALGVEQKILRLRYGQFLGEEFESGGRGTPPPSDPETKAEDDHADEHGNEAHTPDDGHDHAPAAPSRFGDAGNVLAEYGHTHDIAEAATLLDPETRKILKVALAHMWQAELELRSGRPQQALPDEYKALEQIKLVQQASRIYLARVGLELPPVDETRRLSGDRKGLRDRANAAIAATPADADLDAVWQSLRANTVPDWSRWDTWQRRRGTGSADALDLAAAADTLRRDPGCGACLIDLRERLWPLLPRASAASGGRAAIDAAGRAYLDALGTGETKP